MSATSALSPLYTVYNALFLPCVKLAPAIFFKNVFIFKDQTLKKIILKGRGFRCGSDEKMMRMWFGLDIDVVGLPPLVGQDRFALDSFIPLAGSNLSRRINLV